MLFHNNKLHILYISDHDQGEIGITLIYNVLLLIDG